VSGTAGRTVSAAEAAAAVLEAMRGGPAVAVITRVDAIEGGRRLLVREDGGTAGTLGEEALDTTGAALGRELLADESAGPAVREAGSPAVTLYGEAHRAPARLIIVGAGHISVPLAAMGRLLGFPVLVLDDREEFATAARFAGGVAVERMDFAQPFASVRPGPRDAVVLVTRAHRYDYDCLRALLDADPPPGYIGMVGSRRRVRAAFSALLDDGVPVGRVESVHAPIGVEIGAETPAEIAVSIAAELVAARRGVEAAGSLRDIERIVARFLGE
jgi:xanthine dehydrogenase accessory factor